MRTRCYFCDGTGKDEDDGDKCLECSGSGVLSLIPFSFIERLIKRHEKGILEPYLVAGGRKVVLEELYKDLKNLVAARSHGTTNQEAKNDREISTVERNRGNVVYRRMVL